MPIEQILQIKEHMMGDYSVQAVDGRALHEALGIRTRFRDWMPRKLIEASAILGQDYSESRRSNLSAQNHAGSELHEYTLTISLAKDIALMSRGHQAQAVRDYFKTCELEVQRSVQRQLALSRNPARDAFVATFDLLNYVTNACFGPERAIGMRVSNAIQAQTLTAQETGVVVALPDQVMAQVATSAANLVENDADIAVASRVAVGRNYTTVSQLAKDFRPLTSTDINTILVDMGYLRKLGYSTYTVTRAGREYASTRTLQSGRDAGEENVTGWNLDDARFWHHFRDVLVTKRDEKAAHLASRRRSR